MLYSGKRQKKKLESPKPLKDAAEKFVLSNLGHTADNISSRFSCGGKLKLPPKGSVSIAYKTTVPHHKDDAKCHTSTTDAQVIWCEFPGADQTAMSKLLDACTVASFGYKGESVVDKNYRDAFKLDPKDFMTTFQLCDTPILGEIGLINPNCASLQAELYKLNIYAPGGFFKSHVDTPRSAQMFGSLVVCLPTQFSGGELVVRHQKKEIKYDWSSTASDPLDSLCWAAFFSDIEHEVLPVTEGYRATLTYNLYYGTNLDRPRINIKKNPFYKTLQAVLSNSFFLPDGGVLGFNTHYSYTFDLRWDDLLINTKFTADKAEVITKLQQCPIQKFVNKSRAAQKLELMKVGIIGADMEKVLHIVSDSSSHQNLKGADYVIFNSARLLGLPVHIKPLLKFVPYGSSLKLALRNFDDFQCIPHIPGFGIEMLDNVSRLFGANVCEYEEKDISWCQQPQYNQPAGVAGSYGNEPSIDIWYKAAVILVGIPSWSESRKQLSMQGKMEQETVEPGPSVKIFDNVEACFHGYSYYSCEPQYYYY